MNNYKIGDFLENFNKATSKGTCKACQKSVRWERDRLASHKRANCNPEERALFLKKPDKPKNSQLSESKGRGNTVNVNDRSSNSRLFDMDHKHLQPTNSHITHVPSTYVCETQGTKCYVCDVETVTDRLRIVTLSSYSERPIYEIIESLTDVTIRHKERKDLAVCTKCFVSLNKFDDLKQQSKEIQNRLTGLFREKSRPEIVFVKEEPAYDCQDELLSFVNVDLDYNKDFHSNVNTVSCSKVSLDEESWSESDNQEDFDSFHDEDERKELTCSKFTCDLCYKSYRLKSSLELHLATDHGPPGKPFECPICFKTFDNQRALRRHYSIHVTKRNLLCVKCGATFIHKHSFKLHMQMHEDVRPFPCEVPGCTKRFRDAAKRKIHLRVHTGEKIFECSFCPGKRYRQKCGLDLHLESHHKDQIEQPVKCKLCGIKIASSSKLQLHLERVHQVPITE